MDPITKKPKDKLRDKKFIFISNFLNGSKDALPIIITELKNKKKIKKYKKIIFLFDALNIYKQKSNKIKLIKLVLINYLNNKIKIRE